MLVERYLVTMCVCRLQENPPQLGTSELKPSLPEGGTWGKAQERSLCLVTSRGTCSSPTAPEQCILYILFSQQVATTDHGKVTVTPGAVDQNTESAALGQRQPSLVDAT